MGSVEGENLKAAELCEAIQAVVVSVEHRLAPEHPHPAPVQDCYAALKWMAQNAHELAFDVDQLAVVGQCKGWTHDRYHDDGPGQGLPSNLFSDATVPND